MLGIEGHPWKLIAHRNSLLQISLQASTQLNGPLIDQVDQSNAQIIFFNHLKCFTWQTLSKLKVCFLIRGYLLDVWWVGLSQEAVSEDVCVRIPHGEGGGEPHPQQWPVLGEPQGTRRAVPVVPHTVTHPLTVLSCREENSVWLSKVYMDICMVNDKVNTQTTKKLP